MVHSRRRRDRDSYRNGSKRAMALVKNWSDLERAFCTASDVPHPHCKPRYANMITTSESGALSSDHGPQSCLRSSTPPRHPLFLMSALGSGAHLEIDDVSRRGQRSCPITSVRRSTPTAREAIKFDSSRSVLAQPNTRAAAVGVDELDAGFLKGAADGEVIGVCQGGLSVHGLRPPDGVYA
jgi:hypothetical protein